MVLKNLVWDINEWRIQRTDWQLPIMMEPSMGKSNAIGKIVLELHGKIKTEA
jgi:hypothetical protein